MQYEGIIIEESLANKQVLGEVVIKDTRIEPAVEKHRTPWLKQWTLHTVGIPENNGWLVARLLSHSFDTEHNAWYADFKNNLAHYIVFPDKVFAVDLNNPVLYQEAKAHGLALGIPEYQVDFAPKDIVWDR